MPQLRVETLLLEASLVATALAITAGFLAPRTARAFVAAAALPLGLVLVLRGIAIRYVPMTQKAETVASFCFALLLVALVEERFAAEAPRTFRWFRALLLFPALPLLAWAFATWPEPHFPFVLLYTRWYVLHVPISFVCYALWSATFAAAAVRLAGGEGLPFWDERIRKTVFWGFALFSLSMIFGGIWGYVAWGYVFLWDPKILWSAVVWMTFAALVHLGVLKERPKLRAAAAIPAWLTVWVAWLGVNLFRTSIHAF
jgi:hypothetical protein